MANGVILIAGHNVIMEPSLAADKFMRGEITNKQIITTEADWKAAKEGKVAGYEEQSSVSAWAGVTEQPEGQLSEAQIEAEEKAREEAQGYLVAEGKVDWEKVKNETEGNNLKVSSETSVSVVPPGIFGTNKETVPQDKAKLFEEFEEFLAWKKSREMKG